MNEIAVITPHGWLWLQSADWGAAPAIGGIFAPVTSHPGSGGRAVRAAGVRQIGGAVELLGLAEARALRADEILLDVRACGVGNWDEFVR